MARAPALFLPAREDVLVEKPFNSLQHVAGFYRIAVLIQLKTGLAPICIVGRNTWGVIWISTSTAVMPILLFFVLLGRLFRSRPG
jgi:hypothetical protein